MLDKHSKNELVENKQLLSQARSLLNLTQQFSNALQAASLLDAPGFNPLQTAPDRG
jgi:hypothetical protein